MKADPNWNSHSEPITVLAVASAGGHWQQLMQVVEAFKGTSLVLASTNPELGKIYGFNHVIGLNDYNQDAPLKVLTGLLQTLKLVLRVKPDLVLSTGAAPGLLCLLWGRLFGARTIWVDSIANSQKLSLSGRLARRFAHVVLTQWEHLADTKGRPEFKGAVL